MKTEFKNISKHEFTWYIDEGHHNVRVTCMNPSTKLKQEIDVFEFISIDSIVDTSHQFVLRGRDFKKLDLSEIKDSDEIIGLGYKIGETKEPFHNLDQDWEPEKYYVPGLLIRTRREETDDEYFNRVKRYEENKVKNNEKEKLEYLRLKAKYEAQEN